MTYNDIYSCHMYGFLFVTDICIGFISIDSFRCNISGVHSSSLSNVNNLIRRNDDVSNTFGVEALAREQLVSLANKLLFSAWDLRAELELKELRYSKLSMRDLN